MKKLTMVAMSVTVALSLGACSQQKPADTAEAKPAAEAKKDMMVKKELTSGIDLTAMDTSVRPQDDFFRYVNGSWLKNTEIPSDRTRYGAFNVVYDETQKRLKGIIDEASQSAANENQQKLGDFYNTYMNEELVNSKGVKPIKGDLANIEALNSKDDLAAFMGQLDRYGVGSPFGFYVYPDAKNPGVYALWMTQSGLSMPSRDYYLKDEEKFANFRAALKQYVADLMGTAGQKRASEIAENVLNIETKLAELQWDRVTSRDADKTYNKMTQEQVQALLGDFNWKAYGGSTGYANSDAVIVRMPSFFEGFGKFFGETELRAWKDYFQFKMVDGYAGRLSQEFGDLSFGFYNKTLRGQEEQQPRWKRAVSATSSVLGEVLGQEYVGKYFKPEAKERMDTLVENLITSYGEAIKELEWMTDETKTQALDKLSKFTPKIGYPDKWRDYSRLNVVKDDLVGNYKRYNEFEFDYYNDRIGKEVDPTDWGMTPQTINAYYSPVRNEIVFPAGILQPPFFDMGADDAVNYGAIGAVIGHELGHGFDDQGSKYDGDGNLRSWWSDKDREAFDERGGTLASQYDGYEPLEGVNINGKLTLGENIGDLAGMTVAYKAYKLSLDGKEAQEIDGFTGDQRFFLGWGQVWRSQYRDEAMRAQLMQGPHSPGEYRVNGTLPNIPAFYTTFGVKEGDGMYLPEDKRVKIW